MATRKNRRTIEDYIKEADIPLMVMLGTVGSIILMGTVNALACFFSDILSISAWFRWIVPMILGTIMSIIAMLYEKYILKKKNRFMSGRFNGFAIFLTVMAAISAVFIFDMLYL